MSKSICDIKPKTIEVEVLHPYTREGLGWFLQLRSGHDPEVKKVTTDYQNAKLRHRDLDSTVEQFEALKRKLLAKHVCGWRWSEDTDFVITEELQRPEYSEEVLAFMLETLPWFVDFLDAESGKIGRFYKGSDDG